MRGWRLCAMAFVPPFVGPLRTANFTSTGATVLKRSWWVAHPAHPTRRNINKCRYHRAAAMAAPDFKSGPVLLAKAGPNGTLGDCPFSHYANFALRARGVEFSVSVVDLSDKPQWFLDLNENGSTPTYVYGGGQSVLKSSGEIVKHADATGTKGTKLIVEDNEHWTRATEVTAPLFKAFVTYVKSKDDKDRIALDAVVLGIDELLKSTPGKFVISDNLCEIDANITPKLHLISVAGKHCLDYAFPGSCAAIGEYMKSIYDTEEWKATIYCDEAIIAGWSKFFAA